MRKIKKLVSFLLMTTILFLCVGCNDKEPKEPGGNSIVDDYQKSECSLSFDDANAVFVTTEATFDISECVSEAQEEALSVYQTFGSGMCLQRDAVNRIYGTTKGSCIAVRFDGRVYYGTVNAGEWQVYLPKCNAGGPYQFEILSDVGKRTLEDVYFGEVFLLAGQSNMEWRTAWSGSVMEDLYKDATACKNEKIRMLDVEANPQRQPTTIPASELKWDYARSKTIRTFSALGYIFGEKMQRELDCPVGLISTAVGGSILEYWLDSATYAALKEKVNVVTDPNNPLFTPSLGWNGVIYPLLGYNVRGVLWYQGCSNTLGTQGEYHIGMEMLIHQWRTAFANPNLFFLTYELARYNQNPYAYSVINERLHYVANHTENVAVVANLDMGEWNNIHPQDKRVPARRGADVVLGKWFGRAVEWPAQLVSKKRIDDRTVRLTFDKPVEAKNSSNGFEVLIDGMYSFNCQVTASGNTVTVTSDVAFTKIRYGYICRMTDEIKKDVSKMVTLYAGELPVDLFIVD